MQSRNSILSAGSLYGGSFLGLAAFDTIVVTSRGSGFGKLSEKIDLTSRILTLRSLFYQNITWHESGGRSPNKLLSYLTADASSLSAMSGSLIGVSVSSLVNLGVGVIVSHIIAWKIALVLLAAVPVLLASGYLRIRMLAYFNEKHRQAFANSVAVAKDAVDHFQTVALFSLQDQAFRSYQGSLTEPYDETLRLIIFGNFWLALSYGMGSLVYAFAYWWGAYQIQKGVYTQTQFLIVLSALLVSAQQCGQLFTLAPDISHAGVAAKQIFKQLDIGPPVEDLDSDQHDLEAEPIYAPTVPNPRQSKRGLAIQFDSVSFSYPSRPHLRILQSLSITVPPDSLCALTGPSGAGKSTLFSLIEGLYTPTLGTICLNKTPVSSLPESFRDEIALVPQESILFNASIRFNVSLGLPPGQGNGSQADIEEACRLANVHDVICKLPKGYDTVVGGIGGGLLSGVQRQRISLARALVRKPRLLLLDEATSALDSESERIWRETLEDLMARQQERGSEGGTTVVAIAHRLSTVRRASRIFWIDGGRCAAWSTHEELYAKCDGYRRAVDGQGFASE